MEAEKTALTEETGTPETAEVSDAESVTEEESAALTEAENAPDETENALTETEPETAPEEMEIPLSITVDDGLKRISIKNTLGEEIGVFAFRPTDFDMISRFNEMTRRWDDEVAKPLEALKDAQDINDPKVAAALQEAKDRLFELCDYAFGGNMSEAFFGSMNPFSPVDGGLYCENALNAVADFLAKQFNRETTRINRRVKKYMPPTRDHLRKSGKKR